eukprot:TCONS_00003901-protein
MDPLQKLLNNNKPNSWYTCKTPLMKDVPIKLDVEDRKNLMSLKMKACKIEQKIEERRKRKREEMMQACLFVQQKIQSRPKKNQQSLSSASSNTVTPENTPHPQERATQLQGNASYHQERATNNQVNTPHLQDNISRHYQEPVEQNKTPELHPSISENNIVQQMDELMDLKDEQDELESWYEIEKIKLAAKYDQMRLENIRRQKSIIENSHDMLVMSVEKNTPLKSFQNQSHQQLDSPVLFQDSESSRYHSGSITRSSPNTSDSSLPKSYSSNHSQSEQQQKVHFTITSESDENPVITKSHSPSECIKGIESAQNQYPPQYDIQDSLTHSQQSPNQQNSEPEMIYQDPPSNVLQNGPSPTSATNSYFSSQNNALQNQSLTDNMNNRNANSSPNSNASQNHQEQSKPNSELNNPEKFSRDSIANMVSFGSELLLRHYQSVDAKLRRKSRATKFFTTPESNKKKQATKLITYSTDLSPYPTTNIEGDFNTPGNVFTSQLTTPCTEQREFQQPTESTRKLINNNQENTPYPGYVNKFTEDLSPAVQSPCVVNQNHIDTPFPKPQNQHPYTTIDQRQFQQRNHNLSHNSNQNAGIPLSKSTLHIPSKLTNKSISTPALNQDSPRVTNKTIMTVSTPNIHDSQDSIEKTSTPHEAQRFSSPRQNFHHLSLIYGDEIPRMDICNEQDQNRSFHQQRCSPLFALYKGFMVRRLLKTRKVNEIIKTIKDTRSFLSDIDKENRGKFNLADRQLRTRLLDEVSTKQGKLNDILTMSPSDQWTIIKKDRKQKQDKIQQPRNSRPSMMVDKRPKTAPATKKLSAASLKTMKRRQENLHNINNNRPKTAPPPKTPVKQGVSKKTASQRPKSTGRGALKPIQSPHSPTMKKR